MISTRFTSSVFFSVSTGFQPRTCKKKKCLPCLAKFLYASAMKKRKSRNKFSNRNPIIFIASDLFLPQCLHKIKHNLWAEGSHTGEMFKTLFSNRLRGRPTVSKDKNQNLCSRTCGNREAWQASHARAAKSRKVIKISTTFYSF